MGLREVRELDLVQTQQLLDGIGNNWRLEMGESTKSGATVLTPEKLAQMSSRFRIIGPRK